MKKFEVGKTYKLFPKFRTPNKSHFDVTIQEIVRGVSGLRNRDVALLTNHVWYPISDAGGVEKIKFEIDGVGVIFVYSNDEVPKIDPHKAINELYQLTRATDTLFVDVEKALIKIKKEIAGGLYSFAEATTALQALRTNDSLLDLMWNRYLQSK